MYNFPAQGQAGVRLVLRRLARLAGVGWLTCAGAGAACGGLMEAALAEGAGGAAATGGGGAGCDLYLPVSV